MPRRRIDSPCDPQNGVTTWINKGPKLSQKLLLFFQAAIFFRWATWMVRNVPAGKKPLFINMDETSVALSYPGQKGNVVHNSHPTLLPQILIGNRQRFTRQVLRHVWREQPGFVQTWTAESGWVNHTLMKQMITVLHNCIREHTAEFQIIFVVDAARCHIHRDIVNHACKHDMWMLYVPAKMTWLLQPLDAYVFAGFKS